MKESLRLVLHLCCLPLLASMLLPSALGAEDGAAAGKKKDSGPMMRILCVETLADDEEVVVGSKNEDGDWIQHSAVELRSSFITSWMKVGVGKMTLLRRQGQRLAPIGTFNISGGVKRSIVVLLPNKKEGIYQSNVINPEKLGFRKGMALVTNYSRVPALVMLGGKRMEVMPGKQIAGRAVVGDDGMYRMVVGYQDENKELVPCYDRYISANSEARDFLLLFPDSTVGLKVYSLSEFGPFD